MHSVYMGYFIHCDFKEKREPEIIKEMVLKVQQ